jgi:glycosyltransferase involved in cell wall biosynthesis
MIAPIDRPLVDVLLPVRNGAQYIESALRSILADKHLIDTIIVVDDGSDDDTARLVSDFAPYSRLKVIRQEPRGLVAALNRGLEESQSPFIARMDADDISLAGRLQAQLSYLLQHDSVGAVGTQVCHIDSVGNSLGTRSYYPSCPNEIRRRLLEGKCVVSHPTVLFRRSAVERCGGYRQVCCHAEDYDLWLRISERCAIANLPEVYLHYRRHREQISAIARVRQSLSRDLALLSARYRISNRGDPSNSFSGPPEYRQLQMHSDSVVAQLGHAYQAIELIFQCQPNAVTTEGLKAIVSLVKIKYLGETRRQRYDVLLTAASLMAKRRNFLSAIFSYSTFIRIRVAESKKIQSLAFYGRWKLWETKLGKPKRSFSLRISREKRLRIAWKFRLIKAAIRNILISEKSR